MKTDPKLDRFALALLLLTVAGFVLVITGRIIPIIFPGVTDRIGMISYIDKSWSAVFILLKLILGIGVGAWLWRRASEDDRPKWTWACLGVFGPVWALLLYFVIPLYDHLASKHKAEQDEDDQATAAEESKP